MLLYRYDIKPSSKAIAYTSDPFSGKIDGYAKPTTIMSASPETTIGDSSYIYDMDSGKFFAYSEAGFSKTVCAEAILIPQCNYGISLFNTNNKDREEVEHIERGGRVYLTLDFNTDNSGSIWAKVFTLDDSYRHIDNSGYIIYRNSRNNFANVELTDSVLPTVLTNGQVDNDKVERIRRGEAVRNPRLRASIPVTADGGGSGGRTTTGGTTGGSSSSSSGSSQNSSTSLWNKRFPQNVSSTNEGYKHEIATNHPNIVTNLDGFPHPTGFVNSGVQTSADSIWEYDYSITYKNGLDDLSKIYKDHNLELRSIYANTRANLDKYNRFKLAYPDDILSRGYMHVFMTRPDLNLFKSNADELRSEVAGDGFLKYLTSKNLWLVKELVENNWSEHEFMMLLSNKAKGFALTDDGINHDTYGKSRKGYSVAYGRRRDSELGGTMSISYRDTRDFDILNLHKVWVDYIVNVFSGRWTPKKNYIQDKIIDYAIAVYVIVTAENFEDILFWTKYYGVFPVSLPFSAITWDGEASTVKSPDLNVTYAYSWKEDLNPIALAELNMNSFRRGIPKSATYRPTYDKNIAAVDNTWVGAPFVEMITYPKDKVDLTNGAGVTFKLRFKNF